MNYKPQMVIFSGSIFNKEMNKPLRSFASDMLAWSTPFAIGISGTQVSPKMPPKPCFWFWRSEDGR